MEIREFIEGIEWYKGGSKLNYSVSASKIGGDLLPIWLSKKFDKDPSSQIGVAYQGSAFHRGMEEEMNDKKKLTGTRYDVEIGGAKTLSNGWLVTGTADVLDNTLSNIHDYKTTSNSGYNNMKKAARDKTSQLAIQGGTLQWLNDTTGDFFAEVFIRDWKPWRKDHPASAYQQLPVETYAGNQIEIFLLAKTDELQGYLDADTPPPECDNVMWMIYEGNKIKLKCEYYCDYKSNCPSYAKNTNHLAVTKTKIQGW